MPPKRVNTSSACGACKAQKKRCSASRPCQRCLLKGTECTAFIPSTTPRARRISMAAASSSPRPASPPPLSYPGFQTPTTTHASPRSSPYFYEGDSTLTHDSLAYSGVNVASDYFALPIQPFFASSQGGWDSLSSDYNQSPISPYTQPLLPPASSTSWSTAQSQIMSPMNEYYTDSGDSSYFSPDDGSLALSPYFPPALQPTSPIEETPFFRAPDNPFISREPIPRHPTSVSEGSPITNNYRNAVVGPLQGSSVPNWGSGFMLPAPEPSLAQYDHTFYFQREQAQLRPGNTLGFYPSH